MQAKAEQTQAVGVEPTTVEVRTTSKTDPSDPTIWKHCKNKQCGRPIHYISVGGYCAFHSLSEQNLSVETQGL